MEVGRPLRRLARRFSQESMLVWTRVAPEGKEGFGTHFRSEPRGSEDGLDEEREGEGGLEDASQA